MVIPFVIRRAEKLAPPARNNERRLISQQGETNRYPESRPLFRLQMYVCKHLLIGKGQSAQKKPYWGEDRIKRKIYK